MTKRKITADFPKLLECARTYILTGEDLRISPKTVAEASRIHLWAVVHGLDEVDFLQLVTLLRENADEQAAAASPPAGQGDGPA